MNNKSLEINDDFFDIIFGDCAGFLSSLPHCVFRCDAQHGVRYLESVLCATKATGARWGSSRVQLVTERGDFFFGDTKQHPETFRSIWGLPSNQEQFKRHGAYPTADFGMVIDINTPSEVLTRMAEESKRLYQNPFGDDRIDHLRMVLEMIDTLRWAYIPLTDELFYALFVTSKDSCFVEQVIRDLSDSETSAYFVRRSNSRYQLAPNL